GAGYRAPPPADQNLAGVFPVRAAEDLHQRRFARAVLAEQHVDVAGLERQIDAVERDHAGKRLADTAHLERNHSITDGPTSVRAPRSSSHLQLSWSPAE